MLFDIYLYDSSSGSEYANAYTLVSSTVSISLTNGAMFGVAAGTYNFYFGGSNPLGLATSAGIQRTAFVYFDYQTAISSILYP